MGAPLSSASRHACLCSTSHVSLLVWRHRHAPAPLAGQRRRFASLQRRQRADGLAGCAGTMEASSEEASTSALDQQREGEAAAEPLAAIPQSRTWELDFSSRPILDARGKKRWELIICDPTRSWTYTRYFPNNKINSTQLRLALAEILEQPGAVKPERVRFFRGQMQTIITRALTELDIRAVPSRRCFTLIGWLEERMEQVYKQEKGYSETATSLFLLDLGAPQELPDALRGERWSFVQLPLGVLAAELGDVERGRVFGATFPLAAAGLADLPEDALIPGVAVYSARAVPLAAWTAGCELANLAADADRACLVLETGVNQRWRYGAYRRTPENTAEARAWQAAKAGVRGLHFLVVQKDEEAEECAGLWLMQNRELPKV